MFSHTYRQRCRSRCFILAWLIGFILICPYVVKAQCVLESGCENMVDVEGSKPLIQACCSGDVKKVRELIENGANVNSAVVSIRCEGTAAGQVTDPGEYRWTALMAAAYKGHAEVVKELLCHGADSRPRCYHNPHLPDFAANCTARGLAKGPAVAVFQEFDSGKSDLFKVEVRGPGATVKADPKASYPVSISFDGRCLEKNREYEVAVSVTTDKGVLSKESDSGDGGAGKITIRAMPRQSKKVVYRWKGPEEFDRPVGETIVATLTKVPAAEGAASFKVVGKGEKEEEEQPKKPVSDPASQWTQYQQLEQSAQMEQLEQLLNPDNVPVIQDGSNIESGPAPHTPKPWEIQNPLWPPILADQVEAEMDQWVQNISEAGEPTAPKIPWYLKYPIAVAVASQTGPVGYFGTVAAINTWNASIGYNQLMNSGATQYEAVVIAVVEGTTGTMLDFMTPGPYGETAGVGIYFVLLLGPTNIPGGLTDTALDQLEQ